MFRSLNKKMTRAYIVTRNRVSDFFHKEDGDVNIVSIVVLIGIAVLLAIIFRKAIGNLLNNLFNTINKKAQNAIK